MIKRIKVSLKNFVVLLKSGLTPKEAEDEAIELMKKGIEL